MESLRGVGGTFIRVCRGEGGNEIVNFAWKPGKHARGDWDRVLDVVLRDGECAFAFPGHKARQHFEAHNAQGVKIRSLIDRTGKSDFGSDVGDRAEH